MKEHELQTLESLVKLLKDSSAQHGNDYFKIFDNYYVNYKIPQIGKEFDLLRIGKDNIINIELKSKEDLEDIKKQMQRNSYYLKGIKTNYLIFTYVKDGNIYFFDSNINDIVLVDILFLIDKLITQDIDYDINLNDLFKAKNYLISPFNNTERFLNNEYFLTKHQEEIKKSVLNLFNNNTTTLNKYICITGNAGTGKTLLTYDIAKELSLIKSVLIIHCGKLNKGHKKIIKNLQNDKKYNIIICRIKEFFKLSSYRHFDIVIIDEAQRMFKENFKKIINMYDIYDKLIFSYDIKQYLKENERLNITEELENLHIQFKQFNLKNKIRTNEKIASFIKNLFIIGKCKKENIDYNNISIEYFHNDDSIAPYINYLKAWIGNL